MTMKMIQRVPVVQQVADNLKEFILSGKAQVGDKLPPEMVLCEQMGVGRGTVREAFRILQALGLVEIRPGRGAFVAKTSDPGADNLIEWFLENEVEQKDCIEIRAALEPMAVRLAISRCTDADIAQLKRTHEKFLAAAAAKDSIQIAKLDAKFHNQIVEKSKNKLLISINRKVSDYMQSFREKTFQVEHNIKNATGPHSRIFKAIEKRDAAAGEREMRKHLNQVLIDLNELTSHKSK